MNVEEISPAMLYILLERYEREIKAAEQELETARSFQEDSIIRTLTDKLTDLKVKKEMARDMFGPLRDVFFAEVDKADKAIEASLGGKQQGGL